MFIEIGNYCIDTSNIIYFEKYSKIERQYCMIYFKQQSKDELVCLEDSNGEIYNQLYKLLNVSPLFSSVENDNIDDGKVRW